MKTQHDQLAPGHRLGDYEILETIAEGGSSVVYRAAHLHFEREVAIKRLTPISDGFGDDAGRTREAMDGFIASAQMLKRLSHPAVMKVFEVGREADTAYAAFELVRGSTFGEWLARQGAGAPALDAVRPWLEPVLDALTYMHELDLVHRDVAPDNIMARDDGSPVLIDFGAMTRNHEGLCTGIAARGLSKRGYTAPEQALRHARPDIAGDVYSVSAVLYRALTGAPPPDGLHRLECLGREGDPYVPMAPAAAGKAGACRAIDAGLSMWPGERPHSVAELRRTLGWIESRRYGAMAAE